MARKVEWDFESLYVPYWGVRSPSVGGDASSFYKSVCYFTYGVVVMWHLNKAEETEVLADLQRLEVQPLCADSEVSE